MPSLEEVMKDLNKKFKANVVNEGLVFEKIPRIQFSSPRLNYMTYGGIPIGRLIEFSGGEGSGKTTTALDLVKNAQHLFPERKVLYVDAERTLDPEWAVKLGVDISKLILFTPDEQTAEQIFEATKSLVSSGEISLCIIDSLAALVSAQAYEKTIEDKTYGGISVPLTLFSREMIPVCARSKCPLIGINQMREDMNSMYGGTTTPGGKAWRHNCSLRLQFSKSDFIDDSGASISRGCENPSGNLVKVSLLKSKIFKSDRKIGFYTLRYLDGIDAVSDTIDVAVKEGLISKSGAWFSLIDPSNGEIIQVDGKDNRFQGKPKLREFLMNEPAYYDELYDAVLLKIL